MSTMVLGGQPFVCLSSEVLVSFWFQAPTQLSLPVVQTISLDDDGADKMSDEKMIVLFDQLHVVCNTAALTSWIPGTFVPHAALSYVQVNPFYHYTTPVRRCVSSPILQVMKNGAAQPGNVLFGVVLLIRP